MGRVLHASLLVGSTSLGAMVGLALVTACGALSGADDLRIAIPREAGALASEDDDDEEPEATVAESPRDGAASPPTSAAPLPPGDASADAGPPSPMTFDVAADACDGSRCGGGYDGEKRTTTLPTADKLCHDRGYARASDFTISRQQPGGRFCSWGGKSWGCDTGCSGCNPIATVTCVFP